MVAIIAGREPSLTYCASYHFPLWMGSPGYSINIKKVLVNIIFPSSELPSLLQSWGRGSKRTVMISGRHHSHIHKLKCYKTLPGNYFRISGCE